MIIEHIKEQTAAAYASFVARHKLVFHSKSWTELYDSRLLQQCLILNRNREVIGCFLYYQFKKLGFQCIITPPFIPDIALHYVNPAESVVGKNSFTKELMDALAVFFLRKKAAYISVNLPSFISDTQPFIWRGFSARPRHTYKLALSASPENLLAGLSSEKRKSLAKASREQVSLGTAGKEEALELIKQSLKRSGQLKNEQILSGLVHAHWNSPHAIVKTAGVQGAASAASFCIIDRDAAIYLFGGYEEAARSTGAHVLCMWNSILEAKERGCGIFDFEGSMNPGIERYFREFGGELHTYQCVEKISPVMKVLLKIKGHHPL